MSDKEWLPLPLGSKLFLNIDETGLTRASAAIENGFLTEASGFSRFPGLEIWTQLPDRGRVYLNDWHGDMIAGTSKGKLYRIDEDKNAEDVTKVPIQGGRRFVFAKTEDEMVIAAGGQIVRFAGAKTEILSEDAPQATHVAYMDNYIIAVERDSGRFMHNTAGESREWDPLDTFAADGSPDNVTAAIATPFRELLLCGPESIEQFERFQSGDVPFYRRWSVGEGVLAPYAITFADNAVFTLNQSTEWIRFTGQTSKPVSDDIGRILATVDDWSEAWMGGFPNKPLDAVGQKFLILQAPHAENEYGTKGITFVFDYRMQQFCLLYGWDEKRACPARWPGWSHWPMWGETFVGGDDGIIYRLAPEKFSHAGSTQRFLVRTAHWDALGEVSIDNLRIRLKRGLGSHEGEPKIMVRCNRDNREFGRWIERGLGKQGHRSMTLEFGGFGIAQTFQFEIAVTDDCPIEIAKADVQASQVGH
jgi:hypothetical protein